jgi:hypothetical protein
MKFAIIGGVSLFLLLLVAVSVVSLNKPELIASIPFFKTVQNFREKNVEPNTVKEEPPNLPKADDDKVSFISHT